MSVFLCFHKNPYRQKSESRLHEIAHLIGLKSDKETDTLRSAECVRNFLLLCTGKITETEFALSKKETEETKKSGKGKEKIATKAGEHLYNPDQARVPAGNPNGGEWTKDGSKGTSSTADKEHASDSKNTKDLGAPSDASKSKYDAPNKMTKSEKAIYDEIKDESKSKLEKLGFAEDETHNALRELMLDSNSLEEKSSELKKSNNDIPHQIRRLAVKRNKNIEIEKNSLTMPSSCTAFASTFAPLHSLYFIVETPQTRANHKRKTN